MIELFSSYRVYSFSRLITPCNDLLLMNTSITYIQTLSEILTFSQPSEIRNATRPRLFAQYTILLNTIFLSLFNILTVRIRTQFGQSWTVDVLLNPIDIFV